MILSGSGVASMLFNIHIINKYKIINNTKTNSDKEQGGKRCTEKLISWCKWQVQPIQTKCKLNTVKWKVIHEGTKTAEYIYRMGNSVVKQWLWKGSGGHCGHASQQEIPIGSCSKKGCVNACIFKWEERVWG